MNHSKLLPVTAMLIINILLILSGCTESSLTPTPMPSDEVLPTATVIATNVSLNTISVPATPTALTVLGNTPTATSTPTKTSTALPTPQSIIAVMNDPIPTPPGTKLTDQVLWLFETNNNCQLPCWWGIVPGQTEWSIAEEIFNRFDQNIYMASSAPGRIYYGVMIPLPTEIFRENQVELGVSVQDGIVSHLRTHVSIGDTPSGYLTQYTLSSFLTTYGQPSEIWLSTYSTPFENDDLPFRVVLFYADLGVAALYGDNGIKEGELVRGCPQQDPVGFLSLWDASLELTFEDVKSRSSVFNVDFLSLEESTEINVASFYEIFKAPDNTTCLETPANLWWP